MISARNQLKGTITSIDKGAVNAIVKLSVANGLTISSTISLDAVNDLKLTEGKEATAIIKATSVMIGLGDLKLSARNQLPGKIVEIEEGAVNAIVKLQIADDVIISSTISMSAVKELGLAAGKEAKAVIKATSVMVGA
ncbi:Molybdenum-pterin-binding protein II [uncultured Roseburia sp.]|uniref:TOBE domain-containing protein n=1 Tax=Brotonthovivens ammoniilytica TaxID=2981725 RepID=A0ABT2TI72_9FIRM|nr:TOBE domain-containing protein [Brotonthovivens ammoniilytica]MCU6761802.1 TOBE domain-containing protein [Brotonthovivens ammoniilytica]SCI47139.1 Molybdenum-pterin-binding protein II [uncultured Roseburia sp.]